jgi:hypothetical protein
MNATATAQIDDELDFERVDSEPRPAADSQNASQLNTTIRLREDQIDVQPAARDLQRAAQSEEKARRWMWGFLIALAAMQTYFVQEMLAALFLFTLAFAVFAVIAFAFYLANRASQASLERVEPIARVAARAGRRGYGFIEYLSKRPFRRPHSETAQ